MAYHCSIREPVDQVADDLVGHRADAHLVERGLGRSSERDEDLETFAPRVAAEVVRPRPLACRGYQLIDFDAHVRDPRDDDVHHAVDPVRAELVARPDGGGDERRARDELEHGGRLHVGPHLAGLDGGVDPLLQPPPRTGRETTEHIDVHRRITVHLGHEPR